MSTTIPFSPISSTQLVPSCNEEVGRAEFTSGSLSLLMNKNLIYCGGQYIEGSVTLNLDSNTFIRGIWVKFSGLNTINKTKYSGNKIINSDLFNNHEDYHCGGIHEVLFGFGEENDTSNENFNLIEFSRGKRSWPFSFFIPESSPLSYCDDYTELIYSITAVVDAAEIPIAMTHVTYHPIIGNLLFYIIKNYIFYTNSTKLLLQEHYDKIMKIYIIKIYLEKMEINWNLLLNNPMVVNRFLFQKYLKMFLIIKTVT